MRTTWLSLFTRPAGRRLWSLSMRREVNRCLNVFHLCTGIPPNKYNYVDDLVVIVPQNVWEYLYNR